MWIYVIRCGQYAKIGCSNDIARRMEALSRRNDTTRRPDDLPIDSAPLELLGYMRGDVYIEAAFHAAFAPERAAGEWFYVTERILKWADRMLHSLPDMLPAPRETAEVVYHVTGPPPAATKTTQVTVTDEPIVDESYEVLAPVDF
jgi:hypothetical protein